tara:strand:- start:13396 stop:13788 length:393 start_codon:yes stop_codon:yes gene_type:complete
MSVEHYKKLYFKELKKSKYAWGQYFQIRNQLYSVQDSIYEEVNEVREGGEDFNENHTETNVFLMKFIRELYSKAKVCVECPICMEHIDADELETTGCGHNFHTNCLQTQKDSETENKYINCAVCRRRIFK